VGQVYYERVNSYVASDVYDFQSAGVRDVSRRLVDLENTRAAETVEPIERRDRCPTNHLSRVSAARGPREHPRRRNG